MEDLEVDQMFNPDGQEDTAIYLHIKAEMPGVDIDLNESNMDALMEITDLPQHEDLNDMAEE